MKGIGVLVALLLPAAGGAAFAQERPAGPALTTFDWDVEDPDRERLPDRLAEISGLTFDSAGRLFGHDDERAVVYEIDPRRGRVLKAFELDHGGIRGDFEGIAAARGRLFLVTSQGTLYRFPEGADGEVVAFEAFPTAVAERCEVEGLTFDPGADALLLVCKTVFGPGGGRRLQVFSFSLERMSVDPEPHLDLPLTALESFGIEPRLHPSGIDRDPASGGLVLVAAREEVVVEISTGGEIVAARPLPGKRHRQPEGIALAPDGSLVVADEGGGGRARLTVYRKRSR